MGLHDPSLKAGASGASGGRRNQLQEIEELFDGEASVFDYRAQSTSRYLTPVHRHRDKESNPLLL